MNTLQFLFDIPACQLEKHPKLMAGGHWRQGKITTWSIGELDILIKSIAVWFVKNSFKKNDRIILLTDHFSMEWLAVDMAIMASGAISVPVNFPQREKDLKFIIDRIEPTLIIHSGTISISFTSSIKSISFENLIAIEKGISENDIQQLIDIRNTISPVDIATIVHTSGSSGEPRAVCLSHQNIMSNIMSVLTLVPFNPRTKVMSFLPLSHIFERLVCYVYLSSGASIYFLDSYRYAIFALKDIRPDYFSSVPLILERFAAALEDRIEEMGWFTRWAYDSWEKTQRGVWSQIGSVIAHQWIIKRWKRKMGGNLKGIVSGAAYLDPKVERLYERSGIKIRQGYGLTEASPVVAINRFEPGGHKRGTVGWPLPGVDVKIADDGEVLVKGPNVMVGYYKDEEATRNVIIDGWLYTGDVGFFDKDHFLVITDRKSNIYKHASGKFISPIHIESTLTHHHLVQNAIVIGYHRPYTIALIIPDFDALKKVCDEKHIHWTAPEYMIHNTLVLQIYRDILDHLDLQSHERIEKFILLADAWTPENGLLTATYKPRRKEIEEKYAKVVEELYE
ncbi:MAG TPA: AMP-dependent synthetase/ligase [Saprospiraceae bacterium]|nr:AMP-dependent synthetase/ligase [Saprospiraceae bacterium]